MFIPEINGYNFVGGKVHLVDIKSERSKISVYGDNVTEEVLMHCYDHLKTLFETDVELKKLGYSGAGVSGKYLIEVAPEVNGDEKMINGKLIIKRKGAPSVVAVGKLPAKETLRQELINALGAIGDLGGFPISQIQPLLSAPVTIFKQS